MQDTREFVEVDEKWVPIAGSGSMRPCDRCGRSHEIHATMEDSSGKIYVVGIGCAKQTSPELDAKLKAGQSAATTLAKNEAEVAALEEQLDLERRVKDEVDRLPFPGYAEDGVWFRTSDGAVKIRMWDTQANDPREVARSLEQLERFWREEETRRRLKVMGKEPRGYTDVRLDEARKRLKRSQKKTHLSSEASGLPSVYAVRQFRHEWWVIRISTETKLEGPFDTEDDARKKEKQWKRKYPNDIGCESYTVGIDSEQSMAYEFASRTRSIEGVWHDPHWQGGEGPVTLVEGGSRWGHGGFYGTAEKESDGAVFVKGPFRIMSIRDETTGSGHIWQGYSKDKAWNALLLKLAEVSTNAQYKQEWTPWDGRMAIYGKIANYLSGLGFDGVEAGGELVIWKYTGAGYKVSQRTAELGGRKLWWRVHPDYRDFSPESANSIPIYNIYRAAPVRGFSAVGNPWHLWVYCASMGWLSEKGPSKVWNDDVIGFTGEMVTTEWIDGGWQANGKRDASGHDGEPLVVPDMQVVQQYSWDEFERELLTTPFPSGYHYGFPYNGEDQVRRGRGDWDEFAEMLLDSKIMPGKKNPTGVVGWKDGDRVAMIANHIIDHWLGKGKSAVPRMDGRTAKKFDPSQIISWETTRPWDLTIEQAERQFVDGWWLGNNYGTEIASWEDGYIRPKPGFFDLPSPTRRAIAYHEAGHAMVDACGLPNIPDLFDLIDLPGGKTLGHSGEEILAEGYSVLWCEPEWFDFMGADKILEAVVSTAQKAGFPLPSWVVGMSTVAMAVSPVVHLGRPRLQYHYYGSPERIAILDFDAEPPKRGHTYFTTEPQETGLSRRKRENWDAGKGTTKRKPAPKYEEGSGTADLGTVAFLDFYDQTDCLFIAYVGVRDDMRRRGYARQLVDWVYDEAKRRGKHIVDWGQVFYPANQLYWQYTDRTDVETVGKPLDGRMAATELPKMAGFGTDPIDWGVQTKYVVSPTRARGDWGYYAREQALRDSGMPGGTMFKSVENAQRYVNHVLRVEGITDPVWVHFVDSAGESASGWSTDVAHGFGGVILLGKPEGIMRNEATLLHELAHLIVRRRGKTEKQAQDRNDASHGTAFAAEHSRLLKKYMGVGLSVFGALSLEDIISVAEQTMERTGNSGRTLHLPTGHIDSEEYRAAIAPIQDWVTKIARAEGVGYTPLINAATPYMMKYDMQGAQAMVNSYGWIVTLPVTNEMTVLHELAHIITNTKEARSGHNVEFAQTARHLYAKYISPEAADVFWNIVGYSISKTAVGDLTILRFNAAGRDYWVGMRLPENHDPDDYTMEEVTHRYVTKRALEVALSNGTAWLFGKTATKEYGICPSCGRKGLHTISSGPPNLGIRLNVCRYCDHVSEATNNKTAAFTDHSILQRLVC